MHIKQELKGELKFAISNQQNDEQLVDKQKNIRIMLFKHHGEA